MKISNLFRKDIILFLIKNGIISVTVSFVIVLTSLYFLQINLLLTEMLPFFFFVLAVMTIFFMIIFFQGRKIRSREEQLLAMIENSSQGIFVLDENKSIIHSNQIGRDLLKLNENLFLNFCEVCSNYPGAEKICDVTKCFLMNDQENPIHLYIKNHQNESIPVQANISYYITPENKKGTIIALQQVSEKRKEENRKIEKMITHSIFQAQERERRLISRELHDGIGQSLFGILIHTDILKKLIQQESLQKHLEKLQSMIQQTIEDVRNLSAELRPSTLDDHGLIVTLKNFIRDFSTRFAMQINFTVKGKNERLDAAIETALYRIAQEALINAAKYSCAERVDVMIDLESNENEVYLSVTDFGKGFELNPTNRKGVGIYSMEERAHILGGKFNIISEIGKGTKIEVTIPLRHD